ncbi:hypothetical protein TIFTF001_048351 [Ficus carica]|uniref:Leucine-rich repeat-containing N-terminal plant-type domain-containing protein n=1 Tax=Ficus carica TaxID=3494 RepID=A0AA88DDD1_FICCA|nr:hypothetical protein TIFTF001_048351 [Ficus carica]
MGSRKTSVAMMFVLALLLILFSESIPIEAKWSDSSAAPNSSVGCSEKERNALLIFKQGLYDSGNCLSSWDAGENCCNWFGVSCNNQTGHVTKLDLHLQLVEHRPEDGNKGQSCEELYLQGKLSPSLLDLEYLTYLDLSGNYFQGIPIPLFVGSMRNLRYLDLSSASFSGMVPPTLGNLSNLLHLDLRPAYDGNLWVGNLHWLPNLSSLQYLNLGGVNLSKASSHWLQGAVNMLPSLLELHLPFCDLNSFHQTLPSSINFTSLSVLDLSYNPFNSSSSFLLWWFNITTLKYIDLSLLDLIDAVSLSTIARQESLCNLQSLSLSGNQFNGEIKELVNALSRCSNNLTNLDALDLSSAKRSLVVSISQDWIPPFNLSGLRITNCKVGPTFPTWLRTQTNLWRLILSNTDISDTLPKWFWELPIEYIDLSHNKLKGLLPISLSRSFSWVDLSFNLFEGPVPLWSVFSSMNFRSNLLSGPIPSELGHKMPVLSFLDLSENVLNGSIPQSVNRLKRLETPSLSKNNLSGEIPSHWGNMKGLRMIDLSRNNLSGTIPRSLCSLPQLGYLQLSNNNLSGELSLCLQEFSDIYTLDLGENRFVGNIPKWINKKLVSIAELRLRNNMLTGNIPEELCGLTSLHLLDLAHNNFSGPIPSCLEDMDGFRHFNSYYHSETTLLIAAVIISPSISMTLDGKGRQSEYDTDQLRIVYMIDLSRNNLSGEIPTGITNLSYLGTLNLSMNQLSGSIPKNIGDLRQLETLDLFCNHIEGPIPTSMSSLTFLSHLNLSHNDLSGTIPSANQFGTFDDASIYEGNPRLCGPPLHTKCSASPPPESNRGAINDEDDDERDKFWFYVCMGLGFIVGFWAVCGSLVIKRSWRHSYFRFMDNAKDRLLVIIAWFINDRVLRRRGDEMWNLFTVECGLWRSYECFHVK